MHRAALANMMNTSTDVVGARQDQQNRKLTRNRLLKRALWIQTWVVLSLAVAQQQVTPSLASQPTSNDSSHRANASSATPLSTAGVEVAGELEIIEEADFANTNPRGLIHELRSATTSRPDRTSASSASDAVLVLSLVDGSMAGLSRATGQVLWKRAPSLSEKLSDPIVTTTTTTKSSAADWRTTAVPCVDGRVFLTASNGMDNDHTATTTVKELVDRAPFLNARGRAYVGNRQTTMAALDRDSGEILRVVSEQEAEGGEQRQVASWEGRNIVWIGRVDYSVSLFDVRSGVLDVQFSASEIRSANDITMAGSNRGSQAEVESDPVDDGEWKQHAPRLMLSSGIEGASSSNSNEFLPSTSVDRAAALVATPNGKVAYRNPETGQIEWVSEASFETPVAFALDSATGESVGVDILPDAPLRSDSTDYLSQDMERQMRVEQENGASTDDERVIFGALESGQLFAMPLGKRDKRSTRALGHAQTSSSTRLAIGSSKAVAQVPHIGGRHGGFHPFHDGKSETKHLVHKNDCNLSSRDYPGCLVGSMQPSDDLHGGEASFLENVDALPLYNALATIQQYQGGLMMPPQYLMPATPRRKKKNFSKLMNSWLPSTMILMFVLAYGFGRQHRQRKQQEDGNSSDGNAIKGAEFNDDAKGGVRSIGAIQVTEEVLGFGGHGTVVFKGMLDKRYVAVKRMLRAYDASADREISLLIESDGHPNVVRYFLKEVRGDFVYLALELCNMSLHDLIVTFRTHMAANDLPDTKAIPQAMKDALFQIASGVKHLHSLRIVHRDLKPQNILLALGHKRKKEEADVDESSVVGRFLEGQYVAKISDMGLGKQLTGQSSFGLSTLGNASFHGNGVASESSNVVGPGPGSVGWQAPEVMAVRWPADTGSVKSDASSRPETPGVDGSPLDVANRTSRSVDIFSLGCIFYCTLIPGQHPFGEWFEREANIMRNKPNTEKLAQLSAYAHDLISSMLSRDPKARPTAKMICEHPFFWSPTKRLAFLCDLSDRIESDAPLAQENGIVGTTFGGQAFVIERNAADVVGTGWDNKLDPDLINNVGRFRSYDTSSVRDCLRLLRNKHHHYDELPSVIKERLGSSSEGLMNYFDQQFPHLLMHCYSVSRDFMSIDDPIMEKYFVHFSRSSSSKSCQPLSPSVQAPPIPIAEVELDSAEPGYVEKEERGAKSETVQTLSPDDSSSTNSSCEERDVDSKEGLSPEPTRPVCDGLATAVSQTTDSIVLWHGSTATKSFNCRGWLRSDDEWERRCDSRKPNANLKRCADDARFRTRLCNHWDESLGTFCPMRKKGKCVFAHGPVELRVKEGKRRRWGKLVDKEGNNSNPKHSGGEDTYGAARSIETQRKEEGKWNTRNSTPSKGKSNQKRQQSRKGLNKPQPS